MSRNRGLPRLSGGILKRDREAFQGTCPLKERDGTVCGRPAAGVIDSWSGPRPICSDHIPRARELGYSVREEPLQ